MRVTVELDQKSIEELGAFAEGASPQEQVAAAIADWLRIKRQLRALDEVSGIGWDGDLDEMRSNWSHNAAE